MYRAWLKRWSPRCVNAAKGQAAEPFDRRLWMFLSLDLSYPPTPRTCRILGNIPLSRSCVEPDLHRHGTVKDKPSCVLACFPVSLVRNPFNCIHPWFGNPVGKSRPDIENKGAFGLCSAKRFLLRFWERTRRTHNIRAPWAGVHYGLSLWPLPDDAMREIRTILYSHNLFHFYLFCLHQNKN